MNHRLSFLNIKALAIICLLTVTGCGGQAPESAGTAGRTASVAAVLARVDDAIITTADLERAIVSTPRPAQLEYISPSQRHELLEALIDRKLMARQARADGLDRGPVVREALKVAAGDPFERERMLAQIYLKTQLDAQPITVTAIEAYYRHRPTEFTDAERVRITRAVMPDEVTARRAREWLLAGVGAAELKTRAVGNGRAGSFWLQQRGESGPMERVAFALNPGEVSAVFPVHNGVAVLRVDERVAARLRPLAEVRQGIVARLDRERRLQERANLLASLRKKAVVTIDPEALAAYQWQG